MKKTLLKALAILLVLSMAASLGVFSAFAADDAILESESGFYYIEAEGARPRLSAASADKFFQVDGEWFKDMNGNGELDVYEDWRADVNDRVADLLGKMTLQQKAGTLAFGGIGGKNGITVTNLENAGTLAGGPTGVTFISPDSEQMNNNTDPYISVDGLTYTPVAYQIQVMYETTMIAAMTGTPKDQLDVLNKIQSIAEDTELGIPVVFSGDRTYNTWGGMIDAAHYSFGVAHDEELLYDLYSEYAKESVALGYHQVFHGYGNEIGSFYGDDPNYIATMAALETRAYEDNGFNSHSKHFIARGGRSSYAGARSPADLIESWLIGWKAVVDAGTQWIMTNNSIGRTEGLQGYTDKETYTLLRDTLGYDGIICLDWPLPATSVMNLTGITSDGIDISTLTLGERYTLILDVGIDMFSCYGSNPGLEINDVDTAVTNCYHPDAVVAEIEAGKYTEEALDVHVARILKNKFDIGIFENPYRDWGEALELIGSDEYKADQFIPASNEDINRARRSEITEMEERLMVESTILLKNDGILPLDPGQKVYLQAATALGQELLGAALAEKAEVVDSLEAADVAILEVTSFNDAYELAVEDAADAGVPVVTVFEGANASEPSLRQFEDASALLMQTYNNTPDHGSSFGAFYRYVMPHVTVQMLYGEKEPSGKTLFELGYESDAKALAWGELQDDIGVDTYTRLYMAMLAKNNPEIDMPNNLGDVIVTDSFGIRYSEPSDIRLSLLTVPQTAGASGEMGGSGSSGGGTSNISPAPGEPFEIYFVAQNYGGDGLITVPVLDNGEVIAEKVVGVTADQFRVITVTLTLDAGEHEISVGDMSTTITVE